jgi:uncharacterized membrane protein
MRWLARILFGLGLFLLIAGGVYSLTAHEPSGAIHLIITALTSFFLASVLRMIGRADEVDAPEDDVHVGPTIWPFGFAIAGVLLALGVIVSPWILIAGAAAFIASAAGWLRAVTRSHASAPP